MTAKPSAQGALSKTPLEHLLMNLNSQRLSGTLALWPDAPDAKEGKGQDRLLFQDGQIVALRALEATTNMAMAVIQLFRRNSAPYAFYEGHNLLGTPPGLLTDRLDLYWVVAEGLRLNTREDAVSAVLGGLGQLRLRIRAGVPVDRLNLTAKEKGLIELLRAAPETAEGLISQSGLPRKDAQRVLYLLALFRGVETLENGAEAPIKPSPSAAGVKPTTGEHKKLSATGEHQKIVAQAEPPRPAEPKPRAAEPKPEPGVRKASIAEGAPATSPQKTAAGSQPAPRTTRTSGSHSVRPAASSGQLPSRESLRPKGVSGRPPPPPVTLPPSTETVPPPPMPGGLDAQDEARWREIAELYKKLDTITHFDLLGVARSAPSQDVSNAYFVAVKKFHPDRLPPSLGPLSRCAQLLFDRLTEASETLSHPERRDEYIRTVADGGGTRAAERMMRHVVESAIEFQKAEVLIKRREYGQAMELVQSALSKSSDDPDYLATYGWLLHILNPGDDAPLVDILRYLDRALHVNPRSERGHYYKGVVLRRMKRDHEALRHFREAAEINPRNVEAAREVRLASMRKDSKAPPANNPQGGSGGGGIFSKFFGGSGKGNR